MWKPEHRQAAERHSLRYPSDLTDAEWALVGPMIPPARHGGRPRCGRTWGLPVAAQGASAHASVFDHAGSPKCLRFRSWRYCLPLHRHQADEDEQHCYSHPWRIALLERFWQARPPPRYAAYLTPSSPSFPLSSIRSADDPNGSAIAARAEISR